MNNLGRLLREKARKPYIIRDVDNHFGAGLPTMEGPVGYAKNNRDDPDPMWGLEGLPAEEMRRVRRMFGRDFEDFEAEEEAEAKAKRRATALKRRRLRK